MSAPQFARLPEKASSSIQPFTIDFPESEIKGLIDLLKLTPVAESLYENSLPDGDRHLGVRRDWLLEAKKYWEEKYDWFASPICSQLFYREYSPNALGRSMKHTSTHFHTSKSRLPTNWADSISTLSLFSPSAATPYPYSFIMVGPAPSSSSFPYWTL